MLFQVLLALASTSMGDQSSHVSISHGSTSHVSYGQKHHHAPAYHAPAPAYGAKHHYQPTYSHHQPAYGHAAPVYKPHSTDPPACSNATTKPWCLEDEEYPEYEIKHAAEYHIQKLLTLYADVADLNTELSVDRPKTLEEETYLCPSDTAYVKPLRAINTDGKWRVIVNNIDVHYHKLTQTTRIEECTTAGDACPLVPVCIESRCLQKSIYHRFLVYDPYDQYFPFAIETFKLPASCACFLAESIFDH